MSNPQNAPAQRQRSAQEAYRDLVIREAAKAATGLPLSVPPEVLTRAADRILLAFRSAVARDPSIAECTPFSIARCVALSGMTGLFPDGPLPDVYLYPRKINGSQELQWSPSPRGLLSILTREGASVSLALVWEGETFEISHDERGTHLRHVPDPWAARSGIEGLLGAWVRGVRPGADPAIVTISASEILERRACSDSYRKNKGPWVDWPREMALKTAIRYAAARGIVPTGELSRSVLEVDQDDRIDPVQRIAVPASPAALPAPPPDVLDHDEILSRAEARDRVQTSPSSAPARAQAKSARLVELADCDPAKDPPACRDCGAADGTPHRDGCPRGGGQ